MSARFAGPYEKGPALVPSHLAGKILCIAFSPHVDYIATGSDDKLVTIWNTITGAMEYQENTQEPITSILWHPSWRSVLFVGCEEGEAFAWNFRRKDPLTPVLFGVRGAIRALTYNRTADHLAAIASSEVHIARAQPDPIGNLKTIPQKTVRTLELTLRGACWVTFVILPSPQEQHGRHLSPLTEVRPTGIHFLRHGRSLIVSYLSHGIVCWDVYTSKKLWSIQPVHPHKFIPSSALSPDERYIAISNGVDGVDVYPLFSDSSPIRRYRYAPTSDINHNFMVSVAYAHQGRAIVCGSPRGSVNIWDEATEELLQTLVHEGKIVQTVAAALSDTQAFVATAATASAKGPTVLTLWKTKIDPQLRLSSFDTIYRQASTAVTQANQWIQSESDMVEPWIYAHPFLSLFFILLPIILASYSLRSWILISMEFIVDKLCLVINTALLYWNVSARNMWTVTNSSIRRATREMVSVSSNMYAQTLVQAVTLWRSLVEHARLSLRQWLLEPPV